MDGHTDRRTDGWIDLLKKKNIHSSVPLRVESNAARFLINDQKSQSRNETQMRLSLLINGFDLRDMNAGGRSQYMLRFHLLTQA